MDEASKSYEKDTSLTVNFLIAKKDRMAKDLQEAKKRREQSVGSTMEEMKKEILAEISTFETTIQTLYRKIFMVHKAVVHLYSF